MSKDNSGAAFPVLYISSPEPGIYKTMAEGGMTLRDYFAGQAVQGFIASGDSCVPMLARHAYEVADAMLEARK